MGDGPLTLEEALHLAVMYDTDPPVDYRLRNEWILRAVGLAADHEPPITVGFRIDPAEPEWPVVYFELPTGQVSWHLPQHSNAWDGHDTPTKNERVTAAFRALKAGAS